jgi:hypothetical protein
MNEDDFGRAAEVCAGLSEVARKHSASDSPRPTRSLYQDIVTALDAFMECVRYLNTRRSEGATLRLESEADVQDALYLMLRPWVRDLVPEDPNGRIGNRYTIKDFLSRDAQTVIEAKYVRDKDHGRHISRELHDDIETYRHHPSCKHLIFFIYDPNIQIPDKSALERAIQSERIYDGRQLHVTLIVKP